MIYLYIYIHMYTYIYARFSGDTTPLKVTPAILHGVASPEFLVKTV